MKISSVKISQRKLRRFIELSSLVKEYAELKQELIQASQMNAVVQPGPLVMQVKLKAGRRTPAWKDHLIELSDKYKDQIGCVSGDQYAQEILESAKKGSPSKSLTVIDRRVLTVD